MSYLWASRGAARAVRRALHPLPLNAPSSIIEQEGVRWWWLGLGSALGVES